MASRTDWTPRLLQLTSDGDAGPALFRALGVNVKDAAVAALVTGAHPGDGDVAGALGLPGEPHAGLLVADAHRHKWLVGQEDLAVPVEPSDLPDGVAGRRGDVAAEQEGAAGLCDQAGGGCDITWGTWGTEVCDQ